MNSIQLTYLVIIPTAIPMSSEGNARMKYWGATFQFYSSMTVSLHHITDRLWWKTTNSWSQWAKNVELWYFLSDTLKKLVTKESSWRWFDTPWRPRYVIVLRKSICTFGTKTMTFTSMKAMCPSFIFFRMSVGNRSQTIDIAMQIDFTNQHKAPK